MEITTTELGNIEVGRNGAPGSSVKVENGRIRHGIGLSVIIPTKNEAKNIPWVLVRLPDITDEVIIVDAGSTDGTVDLARRIRPDLRVIIERRPGKGAALRAGFAAARGELVVMIDADGSMDPTEIVRYVAMLRQGCDFVKGSRFRPGGGTSDMSFVRKRGNAALLQMVNALYNAELTDLCYGFMGFRRDKLSHLDLNSDGFEIETEIVVRAIKAGLRIGEVPSFEAERGHGQSNLNAWRDGRRVLRTLLSERWSLPKARLVEPATIDPLEGAVHA
jgi:glycosyltransferase involved in cell wall biosynthesis